MHVRSPEHPQKYLGPYLLRRSTEPVERPYSVRTAYVRKLCRTGFSSSHILQLIIIHVLISLPSSVEDEGKVLALE